MRHTFYVMQQEEILSPFEHALNVFEGRRFGVWPAGGEELSCPQRAVQSSDALICPSG
jgi:hypothetical protein